MPWAAVNGTRIYYEVHGSGPPLLLSHGGGTNHVGWWQQVHELAPSYTVVTYDHRGFGLSDDNDQSTAALVDDLEGLIDHLGYERLTLLGQSLGGFAVAGYASRHPDKVQAIVITGSAAGLVPMTMPAGANPPPGPVEMPNYLDVRAGLIRRGKLPKRSPVLCMLIEQLAAFNHRVDLRVLGGTIQTLHDVAPIVEARIPVLLIANDEDVAVTEAMHRIRDLIPGSRLVVIPDADHLVYMEDPQTYNEHVIAFCREHVTATATS